MFYSLHTNAAIRSIVDDKQSDKEVVDNKSCWAKGYRKTCPAGLEGADSCTQNGKTYYKACGKCETDGYVKSCPADQVKIKDSELECNKSYYKCECKPEYKYGPGREKCDLVPSGKCTSDGKDYYSQCSCDAKYKYRCNATGLKGGTSSCGEGSSKKYETCVCSEKSIVENGYTCDQVQSEGFICYINCKLAPVKTCESITGNYVTTCPAGQEGTSVTVDGMSCKKDCKAKTCAEWLKEKYPTYSIGNGFSADHDKGKTVVILSDLTSPYTASNNTLEGVTVYDESYFNSQYSKCTKVSKIAYNENGRKNFTIKNSKIYVPFELNSSSFNVTINGVTFYKEVKVLGELKLDGVAEFKETANIDNMNIVYSSSGRNSAIFEKGGVLGKLSNNVSSSVSSSNAVKVSFGGDLTLNSIYNTGFTEFVLKINSRLIKDGCHIKAKTEGVGVKWYPSYNVVSLGNTCGGGAPFSCSGTIEQNCKAPVKTCEDYGYSSSEYHMGSYYYCPKITMGELVCYSKSCRLFTCADYSVNGVYSNGMCGVEGTVNNDATANQACKNAGYSGKNYTKLIKKSNGSTAYCYMCYPIVSGPGNSVLSCK